MNNFLIIFSFAIMVVVLVWVAYGIVVLREPVLLTKNLFLMGAFVFVGLSGVNSGLSIHYYDFTADTYIKYALAIILFFTVFAICYYKSSWAVRSAQKTVSSWTRIRLGFSTILSLFFVLIVVLVRIFRGGVFGTLLQQLEDVIPAFALSTSFVAALDRRFSFVRVIQFIFVVSISVFIAFSEGGGRRALYGLVFTVPLVLYWIVMKNWRLRYVLAVMFFVCVIFVQLDRLYYNVRWYKEKDVLTEISLVDVASYRLSELVSGESIAGGALYGIGQTATEYSLVSIHCYSGRSKFLETSPFHSLGVLLTLPIPRSVWPTKPQHLGLTLPFDSNVLPLTVQTNCGPGIVGHAYHEGSIFMVILYAAFSSILLRFVDELLKRRFMDPLLLGFVGASSFHMIGWSRGDISTFTYWPLLAYLMMIVLRRLHSIVLR